MCMTLLLSKLQLHDGEKNDTHILIAELAPYVVHNVRTLEAHTSLEGGRKREKKTQRPNALVIKYVTTK